MQVIAHWIVANWRDLLLVALMIGTSALLYALWARGGFPRDATSNGIAIGKAKAFDNRSLALRIERLSAGLETLKVLSQNVQENLSNVQERSASESSLSLVASLQPGGTSATGEKGNAAEGGSKSTEQAGAGEKADGDGKLGMAASDVLTDQLNLASQIFNLQTLFERSLSDRIIGERNAAGEMVSNPRMQTVLGFQVSLTPAAGVEDCVAVVEIGVRTKNATTVEPVSLVALMPQEKTYNAASLSASERSIGGSAVAKILNVNFGGKNRTRQFFLHRDCDTVAFERNSQVPPVLFEGGHKATVFGWEFRPVLGRRAVAPGTRQMLAVVSLPHAEHDAAEELTLEIKGRSYWRRYNRKAQTTRPKSSWLPWRLDSSGVVNFPAQELTVPNIAKIQKALTPTVSCIKWVNCGNDSAAVSITGENFFSGTRVVIGGKVYREEDGNLTLKSDQAMEFQTSIESLVAGDAVLSGRFGALSQLAMPMDKLGDRKVTSLEIRRTTILRLRKSDIYDVRVDVVGLDGEGEDRDYTVDYINEFPEPILFVGNEPVAMPYDYFEEDPSKTKEGATATAPATAGGNQQANITAPSATTSGPAQKPLFTKKYVTVRAFVPGKLLAKNPSVSFRVPFCGLNYQVSKPITFADPTIVRLGADAQNTMFRISLSASAGDGTASGPTAGTNTVSVSLDRNYAAPPDLEMTADGEYSLRVANDTVAKYQKLVVKIGTAESYILPIPPREKSTTKTSIDAGSPPPEISVSTAGIVEWSGVSLDGITQVKLGTAALDFVAYANGSKLRVLLKSAQTGAAGKLTLECQTDSGEILSVPVFVK